MTFSIETRRQSIDALKTQHLDVLIIGGHPALRARW